MSIFFGVSLFGKVDVVPGVFYVATQFEHLLYLPLFPVESFVIIGKRKSHFRGVPIRLCARSVFMGWGRGLSFLAMLVFTVLAVVRYTLAKEDWKNYAMAAVAALVLFVVLMWFRLLTHARYLRALDLARRIGLDDEGMQKLDNLFRSRRARASGFDVIAAPAPTPPATTAAGADETASESTDNESDESEPSVSLTREPVYVTYVLRGRSRVDGAEVEVSVWASDEGEAKKLANHRGIDVVQVMQAKATEPRRRKY